MSENKLQVNFTVMDRQRLALIYYYLTTKLLYLEESMTVASYFSFLTSRDIFETFTILDTIWRRWISLTLSAGSCGLLETT